MDDAMEKDAPRSGGRLVPTPAGRLAAELEEFLGDPFDTAAAGPFSYQAIVAAEERDELPAGSADALRTWGFSAYMVPRSFGGRLADLEELFALTRVVARRNLASALMFGSTLLAANPVWLWGDARQRRLVAEGLLSGDLACFGISEAESGSDLSACRTEASPDGDGFVLSGTKWPVGNANRGRFVVTFAKTGPRAFSLLLVDKSELDSAEWSALPFVQAVGMRGHDLSGISFTRARVPADDVIGRHGSGFVQVLKTLQLTRVAIAALSLGTMDAVIRIGLDYAFERSLYGAEIYQIPIIRDHLVKAHLDLIIAECASIPVARALTVAPGRLSLWSSVVKYLVPVLGDEVVASMGTVLGARSYLREQPAPAYGAFQKLQRDHAVASIFEGTTHVNLANVADQLPYIVPDTTPGGALDAADDSVPADDAEGAGGDVLTRLFSWTQPVPAWEPDGKRLALTNEGHDTITQSYGATVHQLRTLASKHTTAKVAADLEHLVARISRFRDDLHTQVKTAAGSKSSDDSDSDSDSDAGTGAGQVAAFRRARQHCELHTMVSCMLAWIHNRTAFGPAFAGGEWLVACLQRLLQRSHPDVELTEDYLRVVEEAMLGARSGREWFSLTAAFAECPADSGIPE